MQSGVWGVWRRPLRTRIIRPSHHTDGSSWCAWLGMLHHSVHCERDWGAQRRRCSNWLQCVGAWDKLESVLRWISVSQKRLCLSYWRRDRLPSLRAVRVEKRSIQIHKYLRAILSLCALISDNCHCASDVLKHRTIRIRIRRLLSPFWIIINT